MMIAPQANFAINIVKIKAIVLAKTTVIKVSTTGAFFIMVAVGWVSLSHTVRQCNPAESSKIAGLRFFASKKI